jgi:hypothetical protein
MTHAARQKEQDMRNTVMVIFSVFCFLAAPLLAQPGGPPGAGPEAALPPHFIGTLTALRSTTISAKKEKQEGPLSPRMEFRRDDETIVSKGLKNKDRVFILYENAAHGRGYRAIAVLRFPTGTDPEELLKSLPSNKK